MGAEGVRNVIFALFFALFYMISNIYLLRVFLKVILIIFIKSLNCPHRMTVIQ